MFSTQEDIVIDMPNQIKHYLTSLKVPYMLAFVLPVRFTALHFNSEGGIGFGCEIKINSFLLMRKVLSSVNIYVAKEK